MRAVPGPTGEAPPRAQRLLENGLPRLLENQVVRALELVPAPSENVAQVYPKTWYTWTDRTGITVPDISGPCSLANLTPISTADAGTLVISADGTLASMTIGVAIVLWDERGNPMSVNSGMLTLSGWAKNASGNYITANGYAATVPGFLAVDVSLAAGYTVLVQSIIPSGSVNLHTKLF
jgi:hypothetical protein